MDAIAQKSPLFHLRRVAVEAAPAVKAPLEKVSLEGSREEYCLDLLQAIPPSKTSHREKGQVGKALIEALAQSQSTLAVEIAHQAMGGLWMPTSMSHVAGAALACAELKSVPEMAGFGLEMMKGAKPYPMDQSAAALATLSFIEKRTDRDEVRELAQRAQKSMEREEGTAKSAIGKATLEQILKDETLRGEVTTLVDTRSGVEAIEVEFGEDWITVGGHSLPIAD